MKFNFWVGQGINSQYWLFCNYFILKADISRENALNDDNILVLQKEKNLQ